MKEVHFNSIQDIEEQIQKLKQEKKDLLTKKQAIYGRALELMLKEKVIDKEIVYKYLDKVARTNPARALINLPEKPKKSEINNEEINNKNAIDIGVDRQILINDENQLKEAIYNLIVSMVKVSDNNVISIEQLEEEYNESYKETIYSTMKRLDMPMKKSITFIKKIGGIETDKYQNKFWIRLK